MERNYVTVTYVYHGHLRGEGRKCRRLLLAGSPGGRRPVGLWTGRPVLGASRGPPASQWRPHTVHAVANNRAAAAELAACISRRFSFKLTLNRRPQTDRLTNGHGRQAGRGHLSSRTDVATALRLIRKILPDCRAPIQFDSVCSSRTRCHPPFSRAAE